MKKYLVEFIGTFFLVLTVVMAVNTGAGSFAPIAIGAALMVMIFAGGHISGAHYNPAVTLAVFMRGKCSAADVPGYMIAQVLGGVLAALIGGFLLGSFAAADLTTGTLDLAAKGTTMHGIVAEILGTFALCYVILHTATAKGTEGNSFYGLAIGFTVTAMAYALGGVSGGAFNPAVAVGVSVAEMFSWNNIWVYLVGNFAGGALAAIVFKIVNDSNDN